MTQATVTMPLDEVDALRNSRQEALNEAAELRRALNDIRMRVGSGDIPKLIEDLTYLVRNGYIPVLRFATSNLSPEVIRGWPAAALRTIAIGLRGTLPDRTHDDGTLAQVCEELAVDADKWEADRKAGRVTQTLDGAMKDLPTLADLQSRPNPR